MVSVYPPDGPEAIDSFIAKLAAKRNAHKAERHWVREMTYYVLVKVISSLRMFRPGWRALG